MNAVRSRPKIVVIGGGTGNFTLLRALKNKPCDITALVNMTDTGGSTGILRDELGVLPPGDIRQCLVALSDASEELRELFSFRFPEGAFGGHSFGNLFLSAVEKMTDNFSDAVRVASDVLRIKGRVLPITLQDCQLVLHEGSKRIVGQHVIEERTLQTGSRPVLSIEPAAYLEPAAGAAIKAADLIIIAPGNLYASLAPALLVQGVAEALHTATAKIAYVCNLVNKPHHTPQYAVHDYAAEIERFIAPASLSYVLYNTDQPTKHLLSRYALKGEYPVQVDQQKLTAAAYRAIPGKFLSHSRPVRAQNDTLIERSYIRHDTKQVAKALLSLLSE